MKNLHTFNMSNCLQNTRLHSLMTLFVISFFLFATGVSAQSKISASQFEHLKERAYLIEGRYNPPPAEELPPAGIPARNRAAADGNIDLTFNASVTEGYGYVSDTVVQPDGKIIVGGSFQRSGSTRTGNIARFNADGTLDTSFNAGTGASSFVRAVALQTDGKILVGGFFTVFNGQTVNRIVRLNADGSIDSTFNPTAVAFNNQVTDIVVQPDGKILVGGQFTVSGSKLVRLNNDGTLHIAFSGFTSSVNKIVYTADNKILAGGAGFSTSPKIFRINNDGSPDASFNPGTGANQTIFQIAVQPDGKIILGGGFSSYNGTPTEGIVRINDNGSLDTAFTYLTESVLFIEVVALAVQPDGKILASHYTESPSGENITRVTRFNSDATIDATFTRGSAEGYVVAGIDLLADGKILVSGAFVNYNNQTRLRFIKLNSDGTLDNSFNPSVSTVGIVNAIKKQTDGKILVGGDFAFVNGIRSGGIARLNADGTLDNTFPVGVGFGAPVRSLAIQPDGKIVVAGNFINYGSTPAFLISRLNANGSFDTNLINSTHNVAYFSIQSVALQPDGKILAGGSILNQMSSGFLIAIRINANGDFDNTFTTPTISMTPNTSSILVQPSGKIIIGGTFFPSMAFPRAGIARLNSNGTLDSGFENSLGNVYALKQTTDGTVYAAGTSLARYNSEGVLDSTLNIGSGFDFYLVRAVEVQTDGKIVIGGTFSTYNGTPVNRIARLNFNGSLDTTFNSGAGTTGSIFALASQSDGKLLVGGSFLDFNNTEKGSLVRLQSASSTLRTPFDFDGDGKTDISIFRPSVGEWWYRRSIDGGNYAAQFGNSSDKLVPGDYTGDGRADIAIWRPSTGEWFILRSEDGSYYSFPFGTNGDIPAVGDFDGDGKADQAVFRPSDTTWYIRRSSDGGFTIRQFGASGDAPAVADYDGDGKSDIAIWRASVGEWWINKSSDNGVIAFQFGNSADKPVQGDYTGDGKADVAIWRPSTGEWFILRSENYSYYSFPFGINTDIPTPGDYDGDGKSDAAVFRPSDSNWYLQRTTAGFTAIQFGFATDKPVPNAFVP